LGLNAKLKTLLCTKITAAKSKEVKIEWFNSREVWQNLLRKAVDQKEFFCK
jgi:hypothetical protein